MQIAWQMLSFRSCATNIASQKLLYKIAFSFFLCFASQKLLCTLDTAEGGLTPFENAERVHILVHPCTRSHKLQNLSPTPTAFSKVLHGCQLSRFEAGQVIEPG